MSAGAERGRGKGASVSQQRRSPLPAKRALPGNLANRFYLKIASFLSKMGDARKVDDPTKGRRRADRFFNTLHEFLEKCKRENTKVCMKEQISPCFCRALSARPPLAFGGGGGVYSGCRWLLYNTRIWRVVSTLHRK